MGLDNLILNSRATNRFKPDKWWMARAAWEYLDIVPVLIILDVPVAADEKTMSPGFITSSARYFLILQPRYDHYREGSYLPERKTILTLFSETSVHGPVLLDRGAKVSAMESPILRALGP